MSNITITPVEPCHYDEILSLNKELVHFLAEMDLPLMLSIGGQCELFSTIQVEGNFAGFVMAMTRGKDYDGVNYRWFEEHYNSFLYIDRIVLAPAFHGMGLGTAVYRHIFDYAKGHNIPYVTAEIDVAPPNPVSLQFHAKQGFQEVGTLELAYANKKVSLQCAQV